MYGSVDGPLPSDSRSWNEQHGGVDLGSIGMACDDVQGPSEFLGIMNLDPPWQIYTMNRSEIYYLFTTYRLFLISKDKRVHGR